MKASKKRISKSEWQALGGYQNPDLFTKSMGGIGKAYFQII